MAEDKNDLTDKDFVPPASFMEQFSDTPVGEEEEEFEQEEEQENQDQGSGEDHEEEEEEEGQDQGTDEDKKKKEIEDAAKLEEEKTSKMSPEEKQKYLDSKTPPASVKPFEEELLTRFNGKYKSVAEIEEAITKKPEPEFANDTVKFFNDFVKNGGEINNEFISAITTDFDSITDGVDLLIRDMQASDPKKYKGWSNEELEFEIRSKYRMDEWSDDDAEEKNEIRQMMERRMERESQEARESLKTKQASLKYIKPIDPEVEKQAAQARDAAQQKWEKESVPKIIEAISKLSIPISDKETFEFTPDAKDLSEVAETLKSMGNNAKVFWAQFYDKDGKFDHNKVGKMMMNDRIIDKAVKLAREQGKAGGAEEEFRNIKRTDFSKDKKRSSGGEGNKNFDQAAYESVSKNI